MKLAFLVLALFAANGVFSQTAVEGIILNSDKKPAEYAKVLALNPADSSVLEGAFTDAEGKFELIELKSGEIILKIIHASHFTKFINDVRILENQSVNLGKIILEKDATIDLEEVIAAGSLDDLKAGIDKKVYSVEQDISTRGGSANDILNNIPSIDVDQDGNVSLRGDGNVTILIDGRPSALTMGNGKSLLDALPANSIERIEVVTNPSAKYDPDGTSGIINIVLKKNRKKGVNGVVSATAGTGNQYDATLGLSYRNKWTNLYLIYSLNSYQGYRNYLSQLPDAYIPAPREINFFGGVNLKYNF